MRSDGSPQPLIHLDRITKVYQAGEVKIWALRDINLMVDRGEFLAIVGQSGSGKTTLLDILGCLSRPTSGDYWLGGRLVGDLTDRELTKIRNRSIGFVFQTFHLLPRKTALENVALPLLYAGVPPREQRDRSLAMLEAVGLPDRIAHYPTQLSGGQQQRVAIARALINRPDVLFADEPTGNLDTRTGEEILAMFQSLHQQGQTIVMITHDRQLAGHAQRRVTLSDGQVVGDDGRSAGAPSEERSLSDQ